MTPCKPRALLGRVAALALLYALALIMGGGLFVLLLRAVSMIFGPGVLFYRGVGALLCAFPILTATLIALLPRLSGRLPLDGADSFGAAIVATSTLFAAFVLGPVTVDRSISVFMLSQFEVADQPLAAHEARDLFVRTYVNEWAQIDRRLDEQRLSGNLEHTPSGWRLTPQGRVFMKMARALSNLFEGDPRFVGVEKQTRDKEALR